MQPVSCVNKIFPILHYTSLNEIKTVEFQDYVVTNKQFKNCFECVDGSIIEVANIYSNNDNILIRAHKYKFSNPFFDFPFNSEQLGILTVKESDLNNDIDTFSLSVIRRKCIKIVEQNSEKYIVFPIIHSDNV